MLTCREFITFLSDYLSDELAYAPRKAFDSHLAKCLDCQKYLDSYQKTTRLGRAAYSNLEKSFPEEVPEELIQAILTARKSI
jgi:anti-sigma factor RsiW